MTEMAAVTLWRPVGPKELDLIRQSGMRAFPPRLPEQPIFYPVLSEAYAVKIGRDWNVPASGRGYVMRFLVAKTFLDRYQVREPWGKAHLEYWIPAEDSRSVQQSHHWPDRSRSRVRLMRPFFR